VSGLLFAESPAAVASAAFELSSDGLAAVLADLATPDLPAGRDLPVAAEFPCALGPLSFAAEPLLLPELADFAVDESFVAAEEYLAEAVLLVAAARVLEAARSIEKISELAGFELEDFVPVGEVPAEEGRISSATCHQSIGPGVRGALV
jgi:hypothetical protein